MTGTLEEAKAKKEDAERRKAELAACIARVFLGSDDGLRVLKHLRTLFDSGMAFVPDHNHRFDSVRAAIRDGQRSVITEIEAALKAHNPGLWAESFAK